MVIWSVLDLCSRILNRAGRLGLTALHQAQLFRNSCDIGLRLGAVATTCSSCVHQALFNRGPFSGIASTHFSSADLIPSSISMCASPVESLISVSHAGVLVRLCPIFHLLPSFRHQTSCIYQSCKAFCRTQSGLQSVANCGPINDTRTNS